MVNTLPTGNKKKEWEFQSVFLNIQKAGIFGFKSIC